MRYCINIADLMRAKVVDPAIMFLVGGVLEEDSSQIIKVDVNRFDESAILFTCDTNRAQAIIAVIRLKYHRNNLRCYRGQGNIWNRL